MPKQNKAVDGGDRGFYAELKVVGVNLEAAKTYADNNQNTEAHRCLDYSDAHLVHLQADTQTKIAKQKRQPGDETL